METYEMVVIHFFGDREQVQKIFDNKKQVSEFQQAVVDDRFILINGNQYNTRSIDWIEYKTKDKEIVDYKYLSDDKQEHYNRYGASAFPTVNIVKTIKSITN